MPLDERDVLNTLSDSVIQTMDFWVGPVHIKGPSYGIIREHILVGNIIVVSGNKGLAFYDDATDILTTQAGNSPPNLDQRAQLLHECTHALIDVFAYGQKVTRHTDELASYIAQHVYIMRSNPSWTVGPNNPPWFNFFTAVYAMVKRFHLETAAGNGTRIDLDTLEPLRQQLAALPYVNYGSFKKTDLSGADGLKRMNLFFQGSPEEVSTRSSSVAYETYPDPGDDYLARTLLERYLATDVAGYGGRLRRLRRDFAKCSLGRARELAIRLGTRRHGDRVSELFYDRLSAGGRAILLAVLASRA
jgi:hypothetical protein